MWKNIQNSSSTLSMHCIENFRCRSWAEQILDSTSSTTEDPNKRPLFNDANNQLKTDPICI